MTDCYYSTQGNKIRNPSICAGRHTATKPIIIPFNKFLFIKNVNIFQTKPIPRNKTKKPNPYQWFNTQKARKQLSSSTRVKRQLFQRLVRAGPALFSTLGLEWKKIFNFRTKGRIMKRQKKIFSEFKLFFLINFLILIQQITKIHKYRCFDSPFFYEIQSEYARKLTNQEKEK